MAIAREKQIKRWRRSKKIALIEKMNPRWQDLAEHWGQKIYQGTEHGENSLKRHDSWIYPRGPSTARPTAT